MNRAPQLAAKVMMISLVVLISSSASLAEIVIRADENAYPAAFSKHGTWKGMDIDLVTEMLVRAELDYQIESIPFRRSLFQIQQGKIHLIPNLVKNKERSVYMEWLGPTRITCIGLVVQEKNQDLVIRSTDELITIARQRKQKLGYLTGASYSAYFDERLNNDDRLKDTLHLVSDSDQLRAMLKLGRIFGYFHDAFEVRQLMLDEVFANQFKGLSLNPYRIEDSCNGAYIGVSRKLDKARRDKIKAAFKSMVEDGYLAAQHLKWVGTEPTFLEQVEAGAPLQSLPVKPDQSESLRPQ